MGRTVPTYRMHLESILDSWMDYRRALREKDREAFDELAVKARQHASAASYCAHLDPTTTAFLSILLELQREVRAVRDMYMDINTQATMAKTIAVADDVYELLRREKRGEESFSEVIRRLGQKKGSLLEFAGAWKEIPEDEFREMKAAMESLHRPFLKELERRRG